MTEVFSLEETKLLASMLAQKAKRGDCYCLIGDLGAGKTEFARAFIRTLMGQNIAVASPTFNILQIYEASGFGIRDSVYHFDLYRLKNASELEEIGLEDAFEKGITLIEWPEIAAGILPAQRMEIRIEILGENARKISINRHPAPVAGSKEGA